MKDIILNLDDEMLNLLLLVASNFVNTENIFRNVFWHNYRQGLIALPFEVENDESVEKILNNHYSIFLKKRYIDGWYDGFVEIIKTINNQKNINIFLKKICNLTK